MNLTYYTMTTIIIFIIIIGNNTVTMVVNEDGNSNTGKFLYYVNLFFGSCLGIL